MIHDVQQVLMKKDDWGVSCTRNSWRMLWGKDQSIHNFQLPSVTALVEGAWRKEQRRKLAERAITSRGFILAQVTLSLFHISFLAMLRKGKIDTLISPAHFLGPSGAEAEMTYHCKEGEDVTAFTNSCGRKIIILKVCGLYKPYLLNQTTRKLISDTKHLILSNK